MKKIFTIEIPESRNFGLDLLRFFAIFFVVADHSTKYLPKEYIKFLHFFLFDGVTFFFVLSGFLIGGILIKILNNADFTKKTLFDFWKRRWFRTVPAYFLILCILLILNLLFTPIFSLTDKLRYFIFFQNFKTPHPLFFPEAWSLSVEEWFYIITPIIIFILINIVHLNTKKSILYTAIFVIGFTIFYRFCRYFITIDQSLYNINVWDAFFSKQVITRLDSLMFGVLAAYIKNYHSNLWNTNKIAFFAVGIVLILINKFQLFGSANFYHSVLHFTFLSVGVVLLLPLLESCKRASSPIATSITYISLISYSMYLVNLSLVQLWIIDRLEFLNELNQYFAYTKFLTFLFLIYIISFLLYKYFEIPTTKLRDKK
ncbi:MAG: acyltransferase [Chryseobacterium sp.]|jgi:peptidoglycan/LPS O-acetylase OafA/YrhL|uniref:acyltransferase family protein n=1 Tax=Chryseobacterium sp. TaxID=1871047 RepID=UPI00260411B5|nr:acyltransferase [Chryseobacterium sp.]MDF2552045.1 acyltransferase [Chryseobacterium sp.]